MRFFLTLIFMGWFLHFTSLSAEPVTKIIIWRHGHTEANRRDLLSGGADDDAAGVTALDEEGKRQAAMLSEKIVAIGNLDLIYSSDLSRALDTAAFIAKAYGEKGKSIEVRVSKQLREVLHGTLELTERKARQEAASARIQEMLENDADNRTAEKELNDRFRFWKVHPQVDQEMLMPQDLIIDVERYLFHKETKPETPYQLFQRIHRELVRIARENPGKTIGVSTHGACICTLLEMLDQNPRGVYLAPHYNNVEIKAGDRVLIPAAKSVPNCSFFYLIYDEKQNSFATQSVN